MLADACSLGPGITGKVYSYHRWSVICCAHQHCPKKEKMNVSFYLQGVLPVCGYSPKMGHFTVDKALVFGCLVVRTRCFLCWGSGLIPGQGTKILQAARCGQKNKNKQTKKKTTKKKRRRRKEKGWILLLSGSLQGRSRRKDFSGKGRKIFERQNSCKSLIGEWGNPSHSQSPRSYLLESCISVFSELMDTKKQFLSCRVPENI